MRRSQVLRERDRLIRALVADEISRFLASYVHGRPYRRPCATCGRLFVPRSRWHFFHAPACRRTWYAGQFKPKD